MVSAIEEEKESAEEEKCKWKGTNVKIYMPVVTGALNRQIRVFCILGLREQDS